MHPTSSTDLSGCIRKLRELDSRLDQSSFMPQEQLLGMCVAGSVVIAALAKNTNKTQFTDEEVDLVENLVVRIEQELSELYDVSFDDSEEWDSDNGTPESGTPEEWDS